jgi:DNA-binding NarL/FixJ family response regulator
MGPIRVVLAEDHHLVRAGFRALIQSFAGFEVVAEASNGREAVQQVKTLQPDVVLMDIMMPDLDGLGAAVQVAAVSARTRVVIVSMNSGADSVLSAMRGPALQATC